MSLPRAAPPRPRRPSAQPAASPFPSPSPSPESPFVSVRCSLTAHLHPRHLGNVDDGIRSQLNELLLSYHCSLQGVVLAYSSIRLLASCGRIVFDRPFVHVPVSVQLLLLSVKPQRTRLQATVSRVAADHLTLLVLGVLPAVVRKTDIPPRFRFMHSVGEDGRPEPRMVDTSWADVQEGSQSAAGGDETEEKELSAKQQAKLRKRQLKEERRQAFLASQRASEEVKGEEGAASASTAAAHRDLRVGSQVVFSVLAVRQSDDFLSISGSLTAEGCGLIPGPPVVLPGWKEREEEEQQQERKLRQDGRRAEQSVSVDELFGREEEQQQQEEEEAKLQQQQAGHEAALSAAVDAIGAVPTTAARLSKKELKEKKRAARQQRRSEKAERRRMRLQGAAVVASSATVPSTAPLNGSATAAAERSAASVRQQQQGVKQEMEAQGLQAQDDSQQSDDFSHVEQHLITDEQMDSSVAISGHKRARRQRDEPQSGQHKKRAKEGRERHKLRTTMAAGSE